MMSSEPVAGIFIAETGVDVPSVSADQMRELDRIAIEETGPSLLQMMEDGYLPDPGSYNILWFQKSCLGEDLIKDL